ncbi:MAG: helix-turn-helix transcriptional regulator [Acidobacteria bacterium]|nr:helix-turn-helix transcriptional regulator [Acidobacteriota bacterium]
MEQQDYLFDAHPKAGTLDCPLHQALNLISHKWTALIINHLYQARGSLRFRQLQRKVGQVTQKELTQRLRELECLGMISRKVYPEVPPRVEYQLTEVGAALMPPLKALAEWSDKYNIDLQRPAPVAVDINDRSRKTTSSLQKSAKPISTRS